MAAPFNEISSIFQWSMRYIFGIIAIIIGTVIALKSEWFFNFFGRIEFADRYLGTEGGSRLMYKLIGIALVFIAILYMTGGVEDILTAIFLPNRT